MANVASCHDHVHDGTEDCSKCTNPNCPSRKGFAMDYLPIHNAVPSWVNPSPVNNDRRWADAILAAELGIPLTGEQREWVQGARDAGMLPKVDERPTPGMPTTALFNASLTNNAKSYDEDDFLPLPESVVNKSEYDPPFKTSGQGMSFGESHPQPDDRDDDYRKKKNAKVLEGSYMPYPML
ncbi:MAG: hypothetical protein ACYC3X_22110 [Pirellulaceae bacterium]